MTIAAEYRKRAVATRKKSKARLSVAGRKSLLNRAQALEEQAANQDWLDGKSVTNGTKNERSP